VAITVLPVSPTAAVARWARLLTLPDGTRLHVRPILPSDRARLAEAARRLSPESRYRRFFSPLAELSEAQLDHLTQIDYADHFAYVAFLPGAGGDTRLGVARYIRDPKVPDQAEVAVTVADDWQGRGVGTALLEALAEVARANGVHRFVASVLADNLAMRRVFSRYGGHGEFSGDGVVRVVFDLDRSSQPD
jgi:RimJ/RimL family protein N-acetyltransferase